MHEIVGAINLLARRLKNRVLRKLIYRFAEKMVLWSGYYTADRVMALYKELCSAAGIDPDE